MAVDETINNLIKELKQERKSHHKVCNHLKKTLYTIIHLIGSVSS